MSELPRRKHRLKTNATRARSAMSCARFVCALVVGCGVLFAAGCQRRNPLDLEVRAETPYAFHVWREKVLARQPASVRQEFDEAVARIEATSPSRMSLADERMMHRREHPICRELRGRTVREVIVAGYEAANTELLRGMILQSDNLVAALSYVAPAAETPDDGGRTDRMLERRQAVLGAAKAQVAANRRRIVELQQADRGGREGFFVRFARWRVLTLILP